MAVFETVDDATAAISEIIGAGIVPAALEMIDQTILQAVEAAFRFGFPLDAGAVLIMEVDGLEAGLDREAERMAEIVRKIGRITKYETKAYVGATQIIDLEKSTGHG